MSPTAAEKTKFTSLPRMESARSSRSPAATRDSCSPPPGRPTAKRWPGPIKDCRLWYIDITEKKPGRESIRASTGDPNYSWSPDTKWLAYDKKAENAYSVVYLYSLGGQQNPRCFTSNMNNSYRAVFDPEGKYLYYFSDRDFNEVLGNIDFEFANPKTTRDLCGHPARRRAFALPAQSDETQIKKEESPKTSAQPAAARNRAKRQAKPRQRKKEESRIQGAKETARATRKEKEKDKKMKKKSRCALTSTAFGPRRSLAHRPRRHRNYRRPRDSSSTLTTPIQGLSGPLPGESPAIHAYDLKERKEKL